MEFNELVLSVLNESPDSIKVDKHYFSFSEKEGNPITFIIDNIMIVPDKNNAWNDDTDELNSFESKIKKCVIYSPSVIPKQNVKIFNFEKQEYGNHKMMTHSNLDDLLAGLQYNYDLLTALRVRLFNPLTSAHRYFKQLQKKAPNVSYYLENYDSHEPSEKGRLWTIKGNVFASLWLFDKPTFKQYVIPFIKHLNPQITNDNIFLEGPDEETWIKASELEAYTEEVEPYQKEIAELLMQLHMASGDEKKKSQIKLRIKEICSKHNINPEKYGISGDLIKGSEITAQKLLNKSKEPLASLRARTQTSESLSSLI